MTMRPSAILCFTISFVVSTAFPVSARSAAARGAPELIAKGQALYGEGKYREAEVQLRRATERDEKNWEAWYWLALSRLKSNRVVGASRSFLSAVELLAERTPAEGKVDKKAKEALERGRNFLKSRRDDEAVRQFKKATSISPGYAEPYYELAFVAASGDDFDGFFRNFARGVELDPRSPGMHRGVAGVYILLGDAAEAGKRYRMALELDPDSVAVRRLLGPLLIGLGREEEGLNLLREAAKMSPDEYSVLTALGLGLAMTGSFEEAEMQLERAVKVNPGHPEAVEKLAQLYQLQNRYEESAEKIREAIDLRPRSKKLWMELGEVYELVGSSEKAIRAYRKAVQLGQDDFRTHYALAKAYARISKFEQAIDEYKSSIELMPGQASLHYQLGILYGLVGRYEEALSQFKSAISADPEHADAYYATAYLYREQLKDDREAAHYYKMYLLFRPDDPQAPQIRQWIGLVESEGGR